MDAERDLRVALRNEGVVMLARALDPWTIARSRFDSRAVSELSFDENREYAALTHDARRRDWLAGRIAAKRAIAAHVASSSAAPFSMSISHHDGYGLAAVVDGPARIGVDLARVGEIEREHYRYFLAAGEWPIVERIGATAVWALKEAAWKAVSLSPDTPFGALELSIDDAEQLAGLRIDGAWKAAIGRTWRFTDELLAALVCIGGERDE
jgi:4'-phosphopantetheinyl transferase EntD